MGALIPLLLGLALAASSARAAEPDFGLIDIPAGTARLGDANGDANEVVRTLPIPAFRMMRHEVTNAQFAAFVAATGYRTTVEKLGHGFNWTRRWRQVAGATWRRPQGPASHIAGLDEHPVTQVSALDAEAFCAHYGLRLPSEEEWEYAARGQDGRRYPWGEAEPFSGPVPRANAGTADCCAPDAGDGYRRTAPVGRYLQGASPFGLLDMAGNVWEWTSSPFPGEPGMRAIRGGGWGNDAYCLRAAYRHPNPPDIGLEMVGFRCAADAR